MGGNDALSNSYPWYVIDIPQPQHINLPEVDDSFMYYPSLPSILYTCRFLKVDLKKSKTGQQQKDSFDIY